MTIADFICAGSWICVKLDSMITSSRRLEWDAIHRIPLHESKCKAFHGHRYAAEVTCVKDGLDNVGRVVDFSVIKNRLWETSNA